MEGREGWEERERVCVCQECFGGGGRSFYKNQSKSLLAIEGRNAHKRGKILVDQLHVWKLNVK